MTLFWILLLAYVGFILWLGSLILDKAGLPKAWVFCLLLPIVNIIILWVFAFAPWPGVKPAKPKITHDQ